MLDDNDYVTNSKAEISASGYMKDDDRIMAQARKNVRDKKNLSKHIGAFVASWLILGLLYVVILSNITPPWVQSIRTSADRLSGITHLVDLDFSWVVHEAIWHMEAAIGAHVPGVWYFILGIMFAWGAWIIMRITKQASIFFAAKKAKPDPVMQEYKRLKGMAGTDVM